MSNNYINENETGIGRNKPVASRRHQTIVYKTNKWRQVDGNNNVLTDTLYPIVLYNSGCRFYIGFRRFFYNYTTFIVPLCIFNAVIHGILV